MDRNQIIGIVAIFVVFLGYFWLTQPDKEEIEAQRRRQDSLARVTRVNDSIENAVLKNKKTIDTLSQKKSLVNVSVNDSLSKIQVINNYGSFYKSAEGKEKFYTIENEFLKVKISNKGGRVVNAELKQYKTYQGKPLMLMNEENSKFEFNFFVDNRNINTGNLYFEQYVGSDDKTLVHKDDSKTLSFRLYPSGIDGNLIKDKYIEFVYTLKAKSYVVNYKINFKGLGQQMASNADYINLTWNADLPRQEKSLENERSSSTIYYRFLQEDVDYLSETKDVKESLKSKIKWIAFKGQFFTSVLIADNNFNNADIETKALSNSYQKNKNMKADISVPFIASDDYTYGMRIYFGPAKYKILRSLHLDLERQIPLGWSFFLMAWINRYAVLPVFNFLETFSINYGIIILILTILLKLVLFPIAYKTYISSAKMKILKPEIDEISAKYPKKDDALKKQQAIMGLYKRAGVSPLSGCVPMLLQLPILIAMFRFFPASIELRQQKFLWADDLSSYDSVLNLPFNIPFYGDHVSLFTILMTVSTIIYTMINNQMMASSTQQMPGMKTMMYIMPVMFLGIFNNYSSGLSYYYLLANLLTFAQIYGIKKFVDEDKLHRQIQENKKKPVTKSKWQKRLEEMAKQKGYRR